METGKERVVQEGVGYVTGVGGSEGGIHHKCIVEYKSGNLEIKTE